MHMALIPDQVCGGTAKPADAKRMPQVSRHNNCCYSGVLYLGNCHCELAGSHTEQLCHY